MTAFSASIDWTSDFAQIHKETATSSCRKERHLPVQDCQVSRTLGGKKKNISTSVTNSQYKTYTKEISMNVTWQTTDCTHHTDLNSKSTCASSTHYLGHNQRSQLKSSIRMRCTASVTQTHSLISYWKCTYMCETTDVCEGSIHI